MRKALNTIPILIAFLLFASTSWTQASVKGNWNPLEKQAVIDELNAARGSFETFLDSTQVDQMIQCLADKIEDEFENMDEMDGNSEDVERMTFSCLEDMGLMTSEEVDNALSVKGNWSDFDRAQAYENLEYTRSVMSDVVDSSQVDVLFDCVVAKLEMNYSSMAEASNDVENVSLLTSQCIEELQLFKDISSSTKGNWNPVDKASLEEQLEYLRPELERQYGAEKTKTVFNCIREKFENSFDNYAEVNNHPEIYRAILEECYTVFEK